MDRDAGSANEEFGDGAERGGEQAQEAGFAQLMNSFTLDSNRSRRRRGRPGRAQQRPEEPGPERSAGGPAEAPEPAEPEQPGQRELHWREASVPQPLFNADLDDPATLVRPYTWTGGRTKSNLQLELETLVSSNEQALAARSGLQREHELVARLCRHPHSVAEVAAKLAVPLGVARVLLSDMIEQNLLSVHTSPGGTDRAAHFNIMERVLSGLRRL